MIVGKYFDGDDNHEIWLVQDDLYGDALARIVACCREKVRSAEAILLTDAPWIRGFLATELNDHRVMQRAHDLLAAAWRFRSRNMYPSLKFEGQDAWRSIIRDAWLAWLHQEFDAWERECPGIIRGMIQVIKMGSGISEQAYLHGRILEHYRDVPWSDRVGLGAWPVLLSRRLLFSERLMPSFFVKT